MCGVHVKLDEREKQVRHLDKKERNRIIMAVVDEARVGSQTCAP